MRSSGRPHIRRRGILGPSGRLQHREVLGPPGIFFGSDFNWHWRLIRKGFIQTLEKPLRTGRVKVEICAAVLCDNKGENRTLLHKRHEDLLEFSYFLVIRSRLGASSRSSLVERHPQLAAGALVDKRQRYPFTDPCRQPSPGERFDFAT